MKSFWFSFLLSSPLLAWAQPCELPKGQEIVIGCTYKCDAFYRLRLQYTAWKLGIPLKIVDLSQGPVETALNSIDGIMAPGGADIDPKYYLKTLSPELKAYTEKNMSLAEITDESKERDPFEFQLIKKYSEDSRFKKLPLLGICRGMQMMTVTQGIPLFLDIEKEVGISNRNYKLDKIALQTTSQASRIYAREEINAFKIHHQGLRVPYWREHQSEWPQVKVTAFSHDGKVAEAIEFQHRPAIGVQFHPERSLPNVSEPLFKWLLTQSCEYKKSLKDTL